MDDFTFHEDGSITYWSVFNQVWERNVLEIPDKEYAAMNTNEREACLKHFG